LQKHVARHHSLAAAAAVETKVRAPRKGKVRKLGLVERLTGYGYDDSGRDIKCLVEGCRWRYARMYDLRVHLGSANGHAMAEEQVDELMREVDKGCESESESGSEWDEEEGWNERGSGSEDEDWGGSSSGEGEE
jgi:hypothetical protein